MTQLFWKLNRLQAMTVTELGHRFISALLQQIEQVRIAFRWAPAPSAPVSHRKTLFPPISDTDCSWYQDSILDQEKLAEAVEGRIDIFGYQSLDIGRPVEWHRDPLTGQLSPLSFGKTLNYRDPSVVGDVKVLWEIGRHQHLIPLAVAYACTGNDLYRRSIIEQIEGWIASNPYGKGIHWSSSLECALRLISWSLIHSLLVSRDQNQGLFSCVKDPLLLGKVIFQHAKFIRGHLSYFSSANNHLIGELSGLWIATRTFDIGIEGDHWGKFAKNELESQAIAQIYSDGVNKEQAVYYHLWVLEYMVLDSLVGIADNNSFSETFHKRILSMSDFLTDISIENVGPPQFGDADDGFVSRFDPVWPTDPYIDVQSLVKYLRGSLTLADLQQSTQKAFWYAQIAQSKLQLDRQPIASRSKTSPKLFEDGGYALLGDNNIKIVFDAGPLGYPSIAAHGHADALSFCLGVGDEWWLIDPGTYAYHREEEWRDHFRGTSAHNTVVVNRLNQSKIGGPFLWTRHANAEFTSSGTRDDGVQFVHAVHDGYCSIGVIHQRFLEYNPACNNIKVVDVLSCNDPSRAIDISIFFHLASDTILDFEGAQCIASRKTCQFFLRFHLDMNYEWENIVGSTDPIQGWYSPKLGIKVPSPVLVGTGMGCRESRIITNIEICSAPPRG